MGKFNEELVKAGVMLAGEGLHPSSKGARVKFSGEKRTVIDGPFTETKELVAGFWLLAGEVEGRGDRVAQARPVRCEEPRSRFARCSRPRTSGDASSPPSCREQEERLRAKWPAEVAAAREGLAWSDKP